MSAISKLRGTLKNLFSKHLLFTNVALGTGFMWAGDAIQQNIEIFRGKEKHYDYQRAKNMLIIGSSFGLCGHKWYEFLDRRFPGRAFPAIAKKLLCEFALCPPLAFALFVGMGTLNHKPFAHSVREFKSNIYLFCIADWGCFVPAQAVNFYFLPPRFRFLYVSVITMVYDIFLSFILHRHVDEGTENGHHPASGRKKSMD